MEAMQLAVSMATLSVCWEGFSFFFPPSFAAGKSVSALFTSSHDIHGGRTYAFDFPSGPPGGSVLLPESPLPAPVASCRSLRSAGGDSVDSWPPPARESSHLRCWDWKRVPALWTSPAEAVDNFTPLLFVSQQQAASPRIRIPSEGGSTGRDTSPLPSGQSSDSQAVPAGVRMCVRMCACALADTCRKFQMPLG